MVECRRCQYSWSSRVSRHVRRDRSLPPVASVRLLPLIKVRNRCDRRPPSVLATYRRSHMVATEPASISSQIRAEDTLIPLVADVRVDLRRRCQSSTVTKPADWGTAICARDARCKRLH